MARLGCYNCLRFLVVVVSLLAVAASLCLLCVSTWLVVNMQNSYADIVPVLLGGGVLVLIATMGCCGALTQTRWLVAIFCICLLAILVGQVTFVGMLLFKVSLDLVHTF